MIYVHIGRGKVGSSTIQRALKDNAAALRKAGFSWPPSAERTRFNFVALAHRLQRVDWKSGVAEELRALVTRSAGNKVVVSSEFLFTMGTERLQRLRQLSGPDALVLAYVRNYAAWLRSTYIQGIRQGQRSQDFDAYYRSGLAAISVRPSLSRWAEAFGADALRVRHLESLPGDDLVADFGRGIGAELVPPRNKNRSPHWLTIELLRALLECEPEAEGLRARWPGVRALIREFQKRIKPLAIPDAQYCSLSQHRELAALYTEDCAWLDAEFGMAPPPAAPPPVDRPFLPTLATSPASVHEIVAQQLPRTDPAQKDLYLAEVLEEVSRRYL